MLNSKILIVEDNEGDILLMTEALNEIGLDELIIKKDGKEALTFLEREKETPSLIFLDINLPKLTGLEILERVRKMDLYLKIPIIIFSTSSSIDDIRAAYYNGASCFLTKHDNYGILVELISKSVSFWLGYSNKIQH